VRPSLETSSSERDRIPYRSDCSCPLKPNSEVEVRLQACGNVGNSWYCCPLVGLMNGCELPSFHGGEYEVPSSSP
jgi:hypothetical protein